MSLPPVLPPETISTLTTLVETLQTQVSQMQINELRKDSDDHERRIRTIEEVVTEFKVLKSLTMGGGLVGLVNLAALLYLLVKNL